MSYLNCYLFLSKGAGVLLSEDDTTFEGDFSEDWTLNGKVLLPTNKPFSMLKHLL